MNEITAYSISDLTDWIIEPAPVKREWMDETPNKFAYRCLPLSMANSMGWVIRCPAKFMVTWNGKTYHKDSIEITPSGLPWVISHFGSGLLTFRLPWLFKTAKGGLLFRGAPNFYKKNCHALEGYVETDWLNFTSTMNWKIIEPNVTVGFQKHDPICFLQPLHAETLDDWECRMVELESVAELAQQYHEWKDSRVAFNRWPERGPKDWQKKYHLQAERRSIKLAPWPKSNSS